MIFYALEILRISSTGITVIGFELVYLLQIKQKQWEANPCLIFKAILSDFSIKNSLIDCVNSRSSFDCFSLFVMP